MSSLLRLRQRLETVAHQLDLVEIGITELRLESASINLAAALIVIDEILDPKINCNCLEHGFPHKRGQGCPPVLPWNE